MAISCEVTIRLSGNQELIKRVEEHLGVGVLDWTVAEAAHYADGPYGSPDPRLLAAQKVLGEFNATGGSGPKRKK